ncbi:MAG: gliding motility-associated C-terminal domain-containing protein [Flavobacteriales bacterium]
MLKTKYVRLLFATIALLSSVNAKAQSDALPNSTSGICIGDSVLLIPSEGMSYQWTQNPWISNNQLQNANLLVSPLESTVFEVEITFENNQTEINWFEITVEEPPNLGIQVSQESGCVPMPISFSADGIDNTYAHSWEIEGGVFEYASPSFIHTYNNPGEYIPTLQVESLHGCIYHTELNSSILIQQGPDPNFSLSRELLSTLNGTLECEGPTANMTSYSWTTSTGLFSEEANPKFFFESEYPFEIEVCLEVSSTLGCTDSECKLVDFKPNLLLHMPKVFTPNNDGLNDTFGPVSTGVNSTGYHLVIWNRWGAVVFETNDPDEHWNSLFFNKGKHCLDGLYNWHLTTVPESLGEKESLGGSIFLVR